MKNNEMRCRIICTIAVLVLLGAVTRVAAVSTRNFSLDTGEELAAGELDGTAAHSDGSVTLGAQVTRLELPDVAVAWSFARADDGSVYIGTGNEGRVFRMKGEKLAPFADTEQLVVTALASGTDGTLYAGTLPEGRIYQIDSGGEASELVRPGEAEHIWALEYDAKRRTLFAATGPQGKVFAIDGRGKAEEYFDSEAGHIMSLALDEDGTLYAGTSDEALVVRLRGPGKGEIVHDFPGNEITALAARKGTVAVAANEFPDPPRLSPSKKQNNNGRRPKPGKGQLWRVTADGRAEKVFANDEGHFTAVQITADNTFYASSGKDGRVYRVNPHDRTHATWIDVDERQVLAFDLTGNEPLLLTGDAGAVYRVESRRPRDAVWQSKVLDAEFRARWGRLEWRADGQLELQTRSGNTEKPDDTWTEWSAATTSPGPIRSPAARFLQVRARFRRDPDAVLRAVRIYYLPQNQRPVVHDVRLKDGKSNGDEPPSPSTGYALTWDVDNPDDDKLRYRLRFRGEGQTMWRPILREDEKLTKTEHTWDTNGIPDGWYVVQVESSDELSNPASLALQSTAETEPLLIDNHDPRVENLRARGSVLQGRAVDSLGPIAKLEYAVDGKDWKMFFPVDHLLDTRTERFELELGHLEPGEHIVAVRATDAGGNVATAETTVRIAER